MESTTYIREESYGDQFVFGHYHLYQKMLSLIASLIEEIPWKHPVILYGLSRISTRCFETTAISDILKILIICLTTISFIHYV